MTSDFDRRSVLRLAGSGVIASALGSGAASAEGSRDPRDRYIVGTETEQAKRDAETAAEEVYRTFDFGAIGQAVSGWYSENALDGLRNNPNVRYVEENGVVQAFDQETPWGIEKVKADIAIDEGHTGEGVSVAILDTGIDAQHETLEENLGEGWAAEDHECDADGCDTGPPWARGNDIEECLEEWDDDHNHGTHVAGTAGAAANDVGVLGVAPDVTLHAVKVLGCDGSGTFDAIAAGIEWSVDQDHEVQNMSFGGDQDSEVVSDAIEYAVDRNVVLVAAAGNADQQPDSVGFPARHEEVIAVSATDEDDDLADFSSVGPEVELAAPGEDVLSAIPRDEYAEFSGTSMSAPHVAGGAATVIADGTTEREKVRAQLKDAADDIGLDDNEQGAGRLNVAEAVDVDDDEDDDEKTTDPTIDEFELTDRSNPRWARVRVDWAVSDEDGNLDTVESVLNDGVDTETTDVSGSSTSGQHDLRERDGHGEAEVTLTVTDTDDNETTESKTITLG